MIYGSTFSGAGGLDLGLERAGLTPAFFAEADDYRRSVLVAHHPGVPVYDDVRSVGSGDLHELIAVGGPPPRVALLAGGFPCQDVSVAGRRAGLAGKRTGLFWEFARIAADLQPDWLLLENVPGLLSSNDGRDMGTVLGALADLGYGWAYRVLDARHFGVPQRRRRVFIVGRAGGDSRSALLALCESCPGNPEARPCTWQEPTAGARGGARGDNWGEHYYVEDHVDGTLRANGTGGPPRVDKQPMVVSHAVSTKPRNSPDIDTFVVAPNVAATLKAHRGKDGGGISPKETFIVAPEVAATLSSSGNARTRPTRQQEDDVNLVVFNVTPEGGQGADLRATEVNVSPTITPQTGIHDRGIHIVEPAGLAGVRRLTPTECERLMSWPDGFTAPPGVDAPDSARYAACGDGVVANVAEWIARRILAVEEALRADP